MSRGINKVILIGHLGADPEVRYTASGEAVATLRLATSESWKDKGTGEARERTEWHRVVLWRRLGEIARDYLHKGARVYVEGKLETRKWQAQDGAERYTTEIIARDLQMLDGPRDASARRAAPTARSRGGEAAAAQDFQAPPDPPPPPDFDDDIPF